MMSSTSHHRLLLLTITLVSLPLISHGKSIFVLEDLLGGSEAKSVPSHHNPEDHSSHFKPDDVSSPPPSHSHVEASAIKHHHHEEQKNSTSGKGGSHLDHLLSNCHNYVVEHVATQEECAFHSSSHPLNPDKGPSIAVCRWDSRYGASGGCLCPRSKAQCYSSDLSRRCYWYEGKHGSSGSDHKKNKGLCISNAEKFYYVLHNLLLRRGKKDFAIRILYNSQPAYGRLPYGPHGPSIIYPGGAGVGPERHHYVQSSHGGGYAPHSPPSLPYGSSSKIASHSPHHNYNLHIRRPGQHIYNSAPASYGSPPSYYKA